MTLDQFTREIRRQPFRAFQLVMVDGRAFTIDHPEFASIDRRGREVTFHATDNMRHEIDARLVMSIVASDTEQAAGSVAPNPNAGE